MESTENRICLCKTRGLKKRQMGKVVEKRPNPVDVRVGAFVSLCPPFFFLFNNLKKKKKKAAQAGRQGLQTEFVEKRGQFVEIHRVVVGGFPSLINDLGEITAPIHGFSVLCVFFHGWKRTGADEPSTPAWPGGQIRGWQNHINITSTCNMRDVDVLLMHITHQVDVYMMYERVCSCISHYCPASGDH